MRVTIEEIGGIGIFLWRGNSCNILHKTGVKVSMGVFTFLKFSFFLIFLHTHSYKFVVFCGRSHKMTTNIHFMIAQEYSVNLCPISL